MKEIKKKKKKGTAKGPLPKRGNYSGNPAIFLENYEKDFRRNFRKIKKKKSEPDISEKGLVGWEPYPLKFLRARPVGWLDRVINTNHFVKLVNYGPIFYGFDVYFANRRFLLLDKDESKSSVCVFASSGVVRFVGFSKFW